MEFLSKRIKGKKLSDDALKLGEEAKNTPGSINATLGQFEPFDTPDFIKELLNNLNDKDLFSYSPSYGGEIFERSVLKFFPSKLKTRVIATPGGTGAISCSINNFIDDNETIIIPNPCWKPYYDIAKLRKVNVESFELLENDTFNFKGFKESISKVLEKQNKLVFILNDPCNNPTGYSLSIEELNELVDYLNSLSVPVIMIYDCAYIDLSLDKQERVKALDRINDNVLICYTISFSKTFQVYGQRIGALMLASKNDLQSEFNSCNYYARNTWSNTNKAMISLVNRVIEDDNYLEKLKEKLNYIKNSLKERSDLFIKEAKEVNLKIHPYSGGYFISIPCSNQEEVVRKLKEDKIFVLPVCNIIRVAICGLSLENIKGLAKKIKEYVKDK